MMVMKNKKYSRWVGDDDDRNMRTLDGLVMMMIKNMKYSRWFSYEDDEEHELLTLGG